MSRLKHTNDQASRRLRGPRGAPGQEMGTHVIAYPGQESACNCGGCKNGKRIPQKARPA